MLVSFFDQLQRILPFADSVAEDIVCEDTEVLEKIILQLFEAMQRVAKFSCSHIKHGRFSKQSFFVLDMTNADDCRANGRWIYLFDGQGNDRRYGWRVDQGRQ